MTTEEEKALAQQAAKIAELAIKPKSDNVKEEKVNAKEEKEETEKPKTGFPSPSKPPSPSKSATTKKAKAKTFVPKPLPVVIMLQVFKAWRDKKIYIDNLGNYHLKEKDKEKGKIAPWNKDVKKAYRDFADFMSAYRKASKRGLLSDKAKPMSKKAPLKKEKPVLKKKETKLLRRRPIKESVEEKDIGSRLIRRNKESREIPEATYVKGVPVDADAKFAIGKSLSVDNMRDLYETGLKAIQNHLVNVVPKIYIIDILLPRHRVPKSRYLIEEVSPERALTKIRNENEKRIRAKKRPFFNEDDIIKLLVPAFEKSIMEV